MKRNLKVLKSVEVRKGEHASRSLDGISTRDLGKVAGGSEYHCGTMEDWDGRRAIHLGYVYDF